MIGLVCNDRYPHLSRTIFLIGPRDSLYVLVCTPGVAVGVFLRLSGLVAVASLLERHGASCGDLRVDSETSFKMQNIQHVCVRACVRART